MIGDVISLFVKPTTVLMVGLGRKPKKGKFNSSEAAITRQTYLVNTARILLGAAWYSNYYTT